jgi:hypothetical protein
MDSKVAALLLLATASHASEDTFQAPDRLVLKDGRTVRGLILKNTSQAVLLQERHAERSYPKSEILRILDAPDVQTEFTGVTARGDLPSWRIIANDLRTNDAIQTLVEIPAVGITEGVFRNVPYKSFRVNGDLELNIYGDPEDPAGIELGIHGRRQSSPKLRSLLRAYLAGFLGSRQEVAALYAVPFSGGTRRTHPLVFEVTPHEAPDAFGAWWLSLYDDTELNRIRLSDEEYAALTLPFEEVQSPRGRLLQNAMDRRAMQKAEEAGTVLRGFYRDRFGDFRRLGDGNGT